MILGISISGTIHHVTNDNECLCDLNILINKKVSVEYAKFHSHKCCKTCKNIMKNSIK